MVYLIDDKKSRQSDYGWSDDKFASYSEVIYTIRNIEELRSIQGILFSKDDVVLYHESFSQSVEKEKEQIMEAFEQKLTAEENNLYVARFSGSKFSRWVEGKSCMMPPSFLYENLEVFLNKHINGDTNFMYLAYGEDYEIESSLAERIRAINKSEENVKYPLVNIPEKYFFFLTSEDPIRIPFSNCIKDENWEYYFSKDEITDANFEALVDKFFAESQYNCIFLPLCFGDSLSDYLGLRLAMHIRFSDTPNKYVPLIIYGEAEIFELQKNDCFDILKMAGVYYSSSASRSLVNVSKQAELITADLYRKELDKVHLPIPSNIGDNHSIANRWTIYRWFEMIDWGEGKPNILDNNYLSSLYFKYLVEKFGEHDIFKPKKKHSFNLDIKGKTIAYIDDEYEQWINIIQCIIETYGKGKLITFKDFDKQLSKIELTKKIETFIDENDVDCYLLDLRLHDDDFKTNASLTGHDLANYIKNEKSKGNQIVVFTASNKVWNLQKEINEFGAVGYVLKESPEQNLNRSESKKLFNDFIRNIRTACSLSYLKEILKTQEELERKHPLSSQLRSIINLLQKDMANEDQDFLNAALIYEISFWENWIINQEGYECYGSNVLRDENGKVKKIIELVCNNNVKQPITGHLFFKREIVNGHSVVKEVSDYYYEQKEPESGWTDVSDNPVTTISSVLFIKYHMPKEKVQQYVYLKYIRNIQSAHGSGFLKRVTSEMIVNFYKEVIVKVLKS